MRRYALRTALIVALLAGIAVSGNYSPGLSYSSVLKGVKLLYKTGQFRFNHLQGTFFPDGATGWVIIKRKDGTEVYKMEYKTEKLKQPYFLMDFWRGKNFITGQDISGGWIEMKEPGDYIIDFYLADGKKFYTFPFSISKIASPDPFAGGDFYFLDGEAWDKWGYFYYYNADAEKNLQWKVWLRNKVHEKRKDVNIRVEVTRDKDKKLVCQSREHMTKTLTPEWVRHEFDMIFPPKGTSGGAYFKTKDLLAVDGGYTLTLKIDGKHYGTWKFSIKGGKFQYKGRTVRGKADPLTFIEGGRDAFWYERS